MPLLPAGISPNAEKTPTTNVLDYMRWRGDLTLAQSEFNEVDNLILCILAYLDLSCAHGNDPITPKAAVEYLKTLPEADVLKGPDVIGEYAPELISAVADSNRFRDMRLVNQVDLVDHEIELQFSAVTFILPDDTLFLAIRGTDNTLVGWKEDFNMSFIDGVPAQMEAAEYVKATLARCNQPIRIGGHSKGGNLAVWAAAHQSAADQSRILRIYNNDGPGFSEEFLKDPRYLNIRERIEAFVPESSAIGVMMAHDEYTIIKSSESNVMQHAPFSWIVEGTRFIYSDARSRTGDLFEKMIDNILHALTPEEREKLVDDTYEVLSASDMKTVQDLDANKLESFLRIQKKFRELGSEKQSELLSYFRKMLTARDEPEENA